MTFEEKKMLGWFLRLDSPRLIRGPREDVFDFIISFKERLHNLGLVKSYGIDYTTFQFNKEVRQWWKVYIYCRPVGSHTMT